VLQYFLARVAGTSAVQQVVSGRVLAAMSDVNGVEHDLLNLLAHEARRNSSRAIVMRQLWYVKLTCGKCCDLCGWWPGAVLHLCALPGPGGQSHGCRTSQ
jgi:hypothetical protein